MAKSLFHSSTFWSMVALSAVPVSMVAWKVHQGKELQESDIAALAGVAAAAATGTRGRVKADGPVYTPNGLPGPNKEDLPEPPATDKIEHDNEVIALLGNKPESSLFSILTLRRTPLKPGREQSGEYEEAQLRWLEPGKQLSIERYTRADDHLHVKLAGVEGEKFLFIPHIELYNATGTRIDLPIEKIVYAAAMPIKQLPPQPSGPSKTLPNGKHVYASESVIPGGHFFWSEVILGDTRRWPTTMEELNGVLASARWMENIRKLLGARPITITSWLRPPAINRAVGGVSNSYHTKGRGVDFVVSGLTPADVQYMLRNWGGGLGMSNYFTHVDDGPWGRWPYGSG